MVKPYMNIRRKTREHTVCRWIWQGGNAPLRQSGGGGRPVAAFAKHFLKKSVSLTEFLWLKWYTEQDKRIGKWRKDEIKT